MLDPTWYGPKSIILAALEVDLASICASIPTFYPILRERFMGNIFVTQEVHITHQHRRISSDDENNGATGSQYELQPAYTQHNRADSLKSLGGASIVRIASKSSMAAHSRRYNDDFAMKSIVPQGINTNETCVEAQVKSDGQKGFAREQERLRLARIVSIGNDSTKTEKEG